MDNEECSVVQCIHLPPSSPDPGLCCHGSYDPSHGVVTHSLKLSNTSQGTYTCIIQSEDKQSGVTLLYCIVQTVDTTHIITSFGV